MDEKILEKFNQIQILFYKELEYYIKDFSDEVDIKISNLGLGQVIEMTSIMRNNYSLELTLLRKTNNKKLVFSLYDGFNAEKKLCYNFRFFVETLSNDAKRKKFSIEDYCTDKGISYHYKSSLFQENVNEVIKDIQSFLRFILSILLQPEIKKILFSNEWIEVPIDWYPYK